MNSDFLNEESNICLSGGFFKLSPLSLQVRKRVQEITLDMAANMNLIVKRCFPFELRVIDRFHIQQLATDAVQEVRIKYRWQAIDEENEQLALARKKQTNLYSKTPS